MKKIFLLVALCLTTASVLPSYNQAGFYQQVFSNQTFNSSNNFSSPNGNVIFQFCNFSKAILEAGAFQATPYFVKDSYLKGATISPSSLASGQAYVSGDTTWTNGKSVISNAKGKKEFIFGKFNFKKTKFQDPNTGEKYSGYLITPAS
ncbi:hypothetical protein HN446_01530 [bacterium]|jgi:hypothetical protein|nr:hypothetical protein [bacterium]